MNLQNLFFILLQVCDFVVEQVDFENVYFVTVWGHSDESAFGLKVDWVDGGILVASPQLLNDEAWMGL